MDSKIIQITRHGSYGVLLQDSQIFLTLKKSGPYKGLWGLPGGALEFGESPEEALNRELLEETAMAAAQLDLQSVATFVGQYDDNGNRYQFHHVGIIYKVSGLSPVSNAVPEEEGRWFAVRSINQDELTPFAKHVLKGSD